MIDSRSFWMAREEYEGKDYMRSLVQSGTPLLSTNFAKLSIFAPFNRNLLKDENPKGENDVARHADPRWSFTNGGNGYVVF